MGPVRREGTSDGAAALVAPALQSRACEYWRSDGQQALHRRTTRALIACRAGAISQLAVRLQRVPRIAVFMGSAASIALSTAVPAVGTHGGGRGSSLGDSSRSWLLLLLWL